MQNQKAYKFQIVSKGVYEEALNLYLNDTYEENLAKLTVFFENPKNIDVSFEVFFQNSDFKSFIGFVIEPMERQKQYEKLKELLSLVNTDSDMPQTATIIAKLFKTTVTLDNPEFMEVGFDVYWSSRGHVIVKNKEMQLPLSDLIAKNKNFDGRFKDRHIMIESAWNKNESDGIKYRYWIARQLSSEVGSIDEERYNQLIS